MTDTKTRVEKKVTFGLALYHSGRGILIAQGVIATGCFFFRAPMPEGFFEASVVLALCLLVNRPTDTA